jgi:hypothetical protein
MKRLAIAWCGAFMLLAGCYGLGAGVKLPPLETARDFLVPGQSEADGFGLYSYLLFGSPPTQESRDRYVAAIAAYLNFIARRADIEQHVPPAELNVVYVFVKAAPPPSVAEIGAGDLPPGSDMGAAEWVLAHYDFARARGLLHRLGGAAHVDGPYIVSALTPVGDAGEPTGARLDQDLSHAPPEFAAAWVKTFLSQSAQRNSWDGTALQQAALTLRESLSVAAKQWPTVQRGLEKWITWAG